MANKKSSPQNLFSVFLTITIFGLLMALFSWTQISPWLYRNFNHLCQANGGVSCMKFYWQQNSYFQTVLKISLGVSLISGISCLISRPSPHKPLHNSKKRSPAKK